MDVVTLEEETLIEYNSYPYKFDSFFDHTNRCIILTNERQSEEEPLILRILFPAEGTEETYNLSEMLGENIATNIGVDFDRNGAVTLLYRTYNPGTYSFDRHCIYEIDLPSGRVRSLNEDGTPA